MAIKEIIYTYYEFQRHLDFEDDFRDASNEIDYKAREPGQFLHAKVYVKNVPYIAMGWSNNHKPMVVMTRCE